MISKVARQTINYPAELVVSRSSRQASNVVLPPDTSIQGVVIVYIGEKYRNSNIPFFVFKSVLSISKSIDQTTPQKEIDPSQVVCCIEKVHKSPFLKLLYAAKKETLVVSSKLFSVLAKWAISFDGELR